MYYVNKQKYSKNSLVIVLMAIITIIICTVIALNFIPKYLNRSDALFWSGLIMIIGLLFILPFRFLGGVKEIIRSENLIMLGLAYWLLLDLIQNIYPVYGFEYETIEYAFISIALFAIAVWIGSAGKGFKLPKVILKTVSADYDQKSLFLASFLCFLLGISYYVISSNFDPIIMWEGLLEKRWKAPWSRGKFGGWTSFLDHMRYFGYALPALTVVLAHRRGWFNAPVIISVLFSIVFILFITQEGGRRIIGFMFGAAFVCWVLLQNRLKIKQIIILALIISASLYYMQTMLLYRQTGYKILFSQEQINESFGYLHVDDNFLRLVQIINIFPEKKEYVKFEPVIFALVKPIPRIFWPSKPTNPGYDFSKIIGAKGVSLSQSIIGELYACYGLFAVFIGGFVFGKLAISWNRILMIKGGNTSPLVYGMGVMTLFVGLRSMQDLVIISYGILGWVLISMYLARRKKNKRYKTRMD